MAGILDISRGPAFDESIEQYQMHSILPVSTPTFAPGSQIRLTFQNLDVNTYPHGSYLHIEGKFDMGEQAALISNNGIAYLLDELKYELNDRQIDELRYLGFASTLKNYVSLNDDEIKGMSVTAWDMEKNNQHLINSDGLFSVDLPLARLCGFCEDWKKIVPAAKHDLILTLSTSITNSYYIPTGYDPDKKQPTITLTKIVWKLPFVKPAEAQYYRILKHINDQKPINMSFRSWDFHERPIDTQDTSYYWNVRSSTPLERPRFILFTLQTDKKDNPQKQSSSFDFCWLIDFKVMLNDDVFPYENLNVNFVNQNISLLYTMYSEFRKSYYGRCGGSPCMSFREFSLNPIIVVDCSRQKENLLRNQVDLTIKFNTSSVVPKNTVAHCMIIHDRVVSYVPLTRRVDKA